jgi:hypothetical protein
LKDSVFRVKRGAECLYDTGDSMISLEHVRAVIDKPPPIIAGQFSAFWREAGAKACSACAKATAPGSSKPGAIRN